MSQKGHTPPPWQPFVREFLGIDGGLYHVLGCDHTRRAWNGSRSGDPYRRQPCQECAGRPLLPAAPEFHHVACACGSCPPFPGSATPTATPAAAALAECHDCGGHCHGYDCPSTKGGW